MERYACLGYLISAEKAYNRLASKYDSHFKSKVSQAENDVVKDLLKKLMKKDSRGKVLDLGCGTGLFLDLFPNMKEDSYLGCDVSLGMLHVFDKKHPKHTWFQADMNKLDVFHIGNFDYVISLFGSINYAFEDAYIEAIKKLKPRGRFFFMVYTKRYEHRKSYIANREGMEIDCHYYDQVKDLIPKHKAIGFNYTGDALEFLPRFMIRWLFKLGMRTLGRIFPDKAYFVLVTGEKP